MRKVAKKEKRREVASDLQNITKLKMVPELMVDS